MPRIVLLSFTPITAGGGVPRWNRDFISGFPEAVHYSWWDVAKDLNTDPNLQDIPEWEKAKVLTWWLRAKKKITDEDIVIGDNWWVDGLEHRERTISLSHGNWSHTTLEDVEAGIQPEFPVHAAKQLDFRNRYKKAGRKFVAVSDFIAYEMKRQWGFDAHVINNGIDLSKFKPAKEKIPRDRPIIIHGSTTYNKGLDHIELIKKEIDADVWLLDEAAKKLSLPKYEALAQADLVVHPSAHEGNSYFVLETLSCNVPIVSYNIGLVWTLWQRVNCLDIGMATSTLLTGVMLNRKFRSKEKTLEGVKYYLGREPYEIGVRNTAEEFSLENFHKNWREYLEKEFGYR